MLRILLLCSFITLVVSTAMIYSQNFAMIPSLHKNAQGIIVLNLTSVVFMVNSTNTTFLSRSADISGLFDPTLLAAIIGAIVSIGIAAVGAFYGYGLQKKLLRYQKELDKQHEAKQQEEQRKVADLDLIRRETLLAKNNVERAEAYRRGLHADPRISRLQILDMSRPLEIANVYVRVLVHEDARPHYTLDPLLQESTGADHDPGKMLQASRTYLDRRAIAALSPDDAIRQYHHCVIVGDPGAGKTTLLKFLTLKSSEDALHGLPDLPMYVELHHFAAQTDDQNLLDFVTSQEDLERPS